MQCIDRGRLSEALPRSRCKIIKKSRRQDRTDSRPPRRTPLQKPCEAARRPAPSVQRTSSRREDFMQKIHRGVSNIREVIIFVPGKLPEWSNGTDSKSVELRMWFLGFESLTFRHENRLAVSRACFLSSLRKGCRGNGPTPSAGPEEEPDGHTEKRRREGSTAHRPKISARRTGIENPPSTKRTGPADERIRSEKFVRESVIRPRRKPRHTKAVRLPPQRIRRSHERDGHVGQDRSGDRRTGKSTSPVAAVPRSVPAYRFRPRIVRRGARQHLRTAGDDAGVRMPLSGTHSPSVRSCSDPACPAGRPAERTAVPDGKRTRRSDARSEDRSFSMYVTLS